MTSSLAPQPCCRACLDELPYDTHDGLCERCERWRDYWEDLTPEQRDREQRLMDVHASEDS